MAERMDYPHRVRTDSATAPDTGLARLRPSSPNRFRLIRLSEIEFGDQPEWLIEGLLPASGLAFVYGPSGTYKSTITQDVAMAVASGQDWFGRTVLAGAVVYVAAEGERGMRKRLQGLREFKGQADAPLFLCPAAPNLGTGSADRNDLIEAIEEHQSALAPLRLIVIDTLSRTLGGADENGVGMQTVINNAKELAERFDCLVLIVHHTGHDRQGHMRGHSSAHGDADAVLKVSRKPKTTLEAVIVVEKQKDGEDGQRLSVRMREEPLTHPHNTTVLVVEKVKEGTTKTDCSPQFTGRNAKAYESLQRFASEAPSGTPIQQSDVVEAFRSQHGGGSVGADRKVVEAMLKQLEVSGHISRSPDEHDGRLTSIKIRKPLD